MLVNVVVVLFMMNAEHVMLIHLTIAFKIVMVFGVEQHMRMNVVYVMM